MRCHQLVLYLILATLPCIPTVAKEAVLPSLSARFRDAAPQRHADLPTDAELVSQGARIGDIAITTLPIFNTKRTDDNTRLFHTANRLHISTRAGTIADRLLFRSGEPYAPALLRESERLLRDTRYLRDAWILPVAWRDGVVDIAVITQDVWTLSPSVSFGRAGGNNSSSVRIEELNLLGTGIQLSLSHESTVDRDSDSVRFKDPQLGSSWWLLEAGYTSSSDGRARQFTLEQPFYALGTRRAGGFRAADEARLDTLYEDGAAVANFESYRRRANVYLGWSRGGNEHRLLRWSAGLGLREDEYGPLQAGSTVTVSLPNRKLIYPWLGAEWQQGEYRKARNRDQLDKTEDYHLGWRVRASLGWAPESLGSSLNTAVYSASASWAVEPDDRQTWQLSSSLAGRWQDNSVVDGLWSFNANYFYRQSPRRGVSVELGADLGRQLDNDHQLLLGGDNGLRGYPARYQTGSRRWLLSVEQRWYTNWYPLRLFHVGGAAFADFGQAYGRHGSGDGNNPLLGDLGLGLRFGSARSANGYVLHVDLAAPLKHTAGISRLQFLVRTKTSF